MLEGLYLQIENHSERHRVSRRYFDDMGSTAHMSTRDMNSRELIDYHPWGTYGPPGHHHPLKWVKLVDCSDEHLCNILRTEEWHITNFTKLVIYAILLKRPTPKLDGYKIPQN